MGLLSIIKKVKAKEKEMRILMVYAPRATRQRLRTRHAGSHHGSPSASPRASVRRDA